MPFDYPFRHLRIEADGYAPVVSRAFKTDQGAVTWDVKLEHGNSPPVIAVTDPNGRPLANAEVWLFDPWDGLAELHDNRPMPGMTTNRKLGVTGADGKLKLTNVPGTQTWGYVVIHDSGIAAASPDDVAAGKPVVVEPYGRVEGVVMIGAKPAANVTVGVHSPRLNFGPGNPNDRPKFGVKVNCIVTTDANGKFVAEKVMPGPMCVARFELLKHNGAWLPRGFTGRANVVVKSGETARVTVGGQGRPVIGKLVAPPGVSLEGVWGSLRREYPDEYCQFPIEKDGTFRIEDVTGGFFRIYATVYGPHEAGKHFGNQLAQVEETFIVLPSPGGRTDEPQNLGEIHMTTAQ
jgi:hypothetical protein